jgi:tetratricopeptide (TPR) repeat protein
MLCRLALVILSILAWADAAAAQRQTVFDDNSDSVAVLVGNKNYKQTVSVDFAHNDADSIKEYLVRFAGFAEANVKMTKDGTLSELTQIFGSEGSPRGWLWQHVREHRSNVFVYFSGHGIPDLQTRQPALLPVDGDPNNIDTGFRLDTLYRNLEQVRQRIGPERELVVMIDACFTGETGRKGESLLAMSAPGFVPARPRAGGGIIRLVATSGAQPANWDPDARLGLFTSRFLMGVAGMAHPVRSDPTDSVPIGWPELAAYLTSEVPRAARRLTGRDQMPEIDAASIALRSGTVGSVASVIAAQRDERAWRAAQMVGSRAALEAYVAHCNTVCAHQTEATDQLVAALRREQAETDEANWRRLSKDGRYLEYLDSCEPACAFRQLAEAYLASTGLPGPTSSGAKSQVPDTSDSKPPPDVTRPQPAAVAPSPEAAALLERGIDFVRKGDDDLAIRTYSKAIDIGPRYVSAYIARGEAYRRKRMLAEALRDFNKAIELDDSNPDAFYNRGLIYTLLNDHVRAGKDYDAAIRLNPADASALNNRCWTRAVIGQLRFAMEDCDAALRLRPNFADALESRGFTYLKLGQFDHAIADYNAALSAVPHKAEALYGRGLARLKVGDIVAGKSDIAAARASRADIVEEFVRRGVR